MAINKVAAEMFLRDLYYKRIWEEQNGQLEDPNYTELVLLHHGISYELQLECGNQRITFNQNGGIEIKLRDREDYGDLAEHLQAIFKLSLIQPEKIKDFLIWEVPISWRPPGFQQGETELRREIELLFPTPG